MTDKQIIAKVKPFFVKNKGLTCIIIIDDGNVFYDTPKGRRDAATHANRTGLKHYRITRSDLAGREAKANTPQVPKVSTGGKKVTEQKNTPTRSTPANKKTTKRSRTAAKKSE